MTKAKTAADDAAKTAPAAKAPAKAPAKAKKARAKARAIDAAQLTDLAARVSEWPRGNMTDLAAQLANENGLKFRKTSEGRVYAKMAGIEAGARGTDADALVNWANAARRAANGAEVTT